MDALKEFRGTVTVRGQEINWQRNPVSGGWTLFFGACESLHLEVEPTPEIATVALDGYKEGKLHGERVGRSVLQNEFRNLMGCQPR